MSIISSVRNIFRFSSSRPVLKQTEQATSNFVKKNLPEKELFCHKYWKAAQNDSFVRKTNNTNVSLHGDLHGINHHFINSPYPEHMDMTFMNTGKTPREMIFKTDFEFKSLKPTGENLQVYRCLCEKPNFFSEYKL